MVSGSEDAGFETIQLMFISKLVCACASQINLGGKKPDTGDPLQDVPLMSSFLMSCSEENHGVEREWLLQLLAGGMQGPQDADICRSAFLACWASPIVFGNWALDQVVCLRIVVFKVQSEG